LLGKVALYRTVTALASKEDISTFSVDQPFTEVTMATIADFTAG